MGSQKNKIQPGKNWLKNKEILDVGVAVIGLLEYWRRRVLGGIRPCVFFVTTMAQYPYRHNLFLKLQLRLAAHRCY